MEIDEVEEDVQEASKKCTPRQIVIYGIKLGMMSSWEWLSWDKWMLVLHEMRVQSMESFKMIKHFVANVRDLH